jgi:hypothetical protein
MKAVTENNNHVPDEFRQARALREKLQGKKYGNSLGQIHS